LVLLLFTYLSVTEIVRQKSTTNNTTTDLLLPRAERQKSTPNKTKEANQEETTIQVLQVTKNQVSKQATIMTNAGGGGFNKMIIMIPVMLAARKIDAEDPTTIYWLRCAYGTVQAICVLIVVYTYIQASSFASASAKDKVVVYVPAPATVRILVDVGWSGVLFV
jgi:hypothetical protein